MSDISEKLSPEAAVKLLGRLMLAWDGQWFLKVAQECGVETAVALNAKVRSSFGRIEIREFLKAKGRPGAKSVAEAVALLAEYQRLFLGEGLAAEWEVHDDTVAVQVSRCSPQRGAGKAGLRPDTPCVACETVWDTWLQAVMPGSVWTTRIDASMGRGAEACRIILTRSKEGKDSPQRHKVHKEEKKFCKTC